MFWETSGHHDLALVSRAVAVGGRVTERLPLAETARVHQRMEAGETSGRVVLAP